MKHIMFLMLAFVISISTISVASALTPEEREAKNIERMEAKEARNIERTEKKDDRIEAREEKRGEREEKKEARLDNRAEKSANRAERFARHWSYIDSRLSTIVTRLQDAGVDTDTLEKLITSLEAKAGSVQSAYNTLEEAIAGGDKDTIQSANAAVKKTRQELKSHYRDQVRAEVKSLVTDLKK